MALPVELYSTAQVRAADARAIAAGTPGYTLMKRAGEAALRCLRSRWPMAHRVVIACGPGNNGGDGYVLARFAQAAGLTVSALACGETAFLRGDARRAFEDWRASGGEPRPFAAELLREGEVLVDALLGTGLAGPVRPEMVAVIAALNAAGRPLFALDIPSGLDGDSGQVHGVAVRAEATVTFVGLKSGLYLGQGPEHCGTVFFDDLELSMPAAQSGPPPFTRIVESEIQAALPRRPREANKGDFGRVLVVGGGAGMPGAARLAGEAALRVGAGRVTVAVAPQNVMAIAAGRPELMCVPLESAAQLEAPISRADVIAVGPGLGTGDWARKVLQAVLDCGRPLVVDADALNLLAAPSRTQWILTPHPGEAARLLGQTADAVQADRPAALAALLVRCGGTVVLKGAGTLVGSLGRPVGVCERGNPGMASAGMGDVLTGTIAGILAQCGDPWLAARAGVLVHALAGDAAARAGERGILALDLMGELRRGVNL
ncbi:MAG: NAD(P)H-hydrate dehydratase [Proteobacteria bacterium]|nr:NAD(P)H-hydrate dehydratase [Pseudomonadota bacterium]